MKSGFVSLIGRPNVGKSTLLNCLVNAHVAITSNKPQTTRNIIQGVYNEKDLIRISFFYASNKKTSFVLPLPSTYNIHILNDW